MNKHHPASFYLATIGALAILVCPIRADNFGSGANSFTIDFVSVLNAGNGNDAGAGGGSFSSPYGGVAYEFRMGKFEISQEQIDKATAGGLTNVTTGPHTGAEPAANFTWYEAAAFVNWLNDQRTPGLRAYNLNGTATELTLWAPEDAWDNDPGPEADLNLYRHKDAYYFLPSEHEWYKAAYHKNDGVTANYWDYATGGNTAPTQELTGGTTPGSAVYNGVEAGTPADPADVNLAGGLSPYGTMGQSGNVLEWNESAFHEPNDSPSGFRVIRGGGWPSAESLLRSSFRTNIPPTSTGSVEGIRVASVFRLAPPPSQIVSRKLHNGVPFDINLPLTGNPGIECRSGGATNDYQVVLTFPTAVTFNGASVVAGTGSVSSSGGNGSTTLVVNLTGITTGQVSTLALAGVSNGTTTGDLDVPMGVLVGDSNSDGTVNSGDATQTRNRSGQVTGATNFRSDYNLDAFINSGDATIVRSRSGQSIP